MRGRRGLPLEEWRAAFGAHGILGARMAEQKEARHAAPPRALACCDLPPILVAMGSAHTRERGDFARRTPDDMQCSPPLEGVASYQKPW